MSKNTAQENIDAQDRLYDDIGEALVRFTERTGLWVDAVAWHCRKAYNYEGSPYGGVYGDFRSTLQSGTTSSFDAKIIKQKGE